MKKYEIRIPRNVRMIEWETLIVMGNDEAEAIENALNYDNVVSQSEWEEEDHETIERYDSEIQIREIKDEKV